MGENDEKPIRVVDRRMFTPDGELRPDFEPEEPASPPPPPPPPASPRPSPATASPSSPSGPSVAPGASKAGGSPQERPASAPGGESESEYPEAAGEAGGPPPAGSSEPRGEFTAIVRSLATTAYSALGLMPDPSGARHREPAVARQMIDWLSVLESKTRSNLSFEESDFLSRVLYDLRMAFVEVMGPAGGGGTGRPRPPGR